MRTEVRYRRRPPVAAILLVGIALVAGCGGSGAAGAGDPSAPPSSSGGKRSVLSHALAEAGYDSEAAAIQSERATITPLEPPFLRTWRILKVEVREPSHPVLFYVGWNGERALRLTSSEDAFNEMAAADAGKVRDARQAESLAKTYVETTRSTSTLSYVVTTVEDIRWRPNLDGEARQRRDRIASEFGPQLAPATARKTAEGYAVTVYVVHGQELQRRTLTVSPEGTVNGRTATLVDDLPVPYST